MDQKIIYKVRGIRKAFKRTRLHKGREKVKRNTHTQLSTLQFYGIALKRVVYLFLYNSTQVSNILFLQINIPTVMEAYCIQCSLRELSI